MERDAAWRRKSDPRSTLLDALEEPAAICEVGGRVVAANSAFLAARGAEIGPLRQGSGLFAAFRAARDEGRGEGLLTCGAMERPIRLTRLDETICWPGCRRQAWSLTRRRRPRPRLRA